MPGMNSFKYIFSTLDSIPINVTWMLQSIAEKRGHQELYARQSPEKLIAPAINQVDSAA